MSCKDEIIFIFILPKLNENIGGQNSLTVVRGERHARLVIV